MILMDGIGANVINGDSHGFKLIKTDDKRICCNF